MPTAAIAVEKFAQTTGRGMAKVQGLPDYPIVTIPHDRGPLEDIRHNPQEIRRVAEIATNKVVLVLTSGVIEAASDHRLSEAKAQDQQPSPGR